MIFVDTGAFVARYLRRDQYHEGSVVAWHHLEVTGARLVTSNFVLDELLTLLARRSSYEFAARRARVLLASHCLKILRPDESIELAAVAAFEKYADQKVSFTDCTSFVLMRSHGLQRAFTFDRHFALAGFEVWPAPS